MDKEIKKKILRNWFKILQEVICNDIENLELRLSHTSIYKDRHKLTICYQFNEFKIKNLINTDNFFEQDQA